MTEHRTIPERLAALPDALRAEVERGLGQTTADPLLRLAEDVALLCRETGRAWPLTTPRQPTKTARGKPWAGDEAVEALRMIDEGLPDRVVAEAITAAGWPRTTAAVSHLRRRERGMRRRRPLPEEVDRICSLREQGHSIAEVARRVERHPDTVRRVLALQGMAKPDLDARAGRLTLAELADDLGVAYSTAATVALEVRARKQGATDGVDEAGALAVAEALLSRPRSRMTAAQRKRLLRAAEKYRGGAE